MNNNLDIFCCFKVHFMNEENKTLSFFTFSLFFVFFYVVMWLVLIQLMVSGKHLLTFDSIFIKITSRDLY